MNFFIDWKSRNPGVLDDRPLELLRPGQMYTELSGEDSILHLKSLLGNLYPANSVHHLKTTNPHFQQVWDGAKKAEWRPLDRPYSFGDILLLHEYDDKDYVFLSRLVAVRISLITKDCPEFEIPRNRGMLHLEDEKVNFLIKNWPEGGDAHAV